MTIGRAWKPASLPLALKCGGTEPFWSFKTVENGLVFSLPDTPDRPLALRKVMDVFKKREVYRHMSNAADKLAGAGSCLHDIVVKTI